MSLFLIFTIGLSMQTVGAQCPTLYPKVIGGRNNNTFLYDVDYYQATDSLVAVGATSDASLTTYSCSNIQYEAIFFYTASVQTWNKVAYYNQYGCNSSSASMVTFSTDGAHILVYSTVYEWYQIWDISGNLINMLQFQNNGQLATGIKTMAMVLESDLTYSLYIVRVGAGITKVANVLASPTSSTLTLSYVPQNIANFGLQYDSNTQSIYTGHSTTSPYVNYFAKHSTTDFTTQILAQITIGTDSYSFFQFKYQATVQTIISISNTFRLCLINLTTGTYISVQPFGNWVTTATVLALVNIDNSQIYMLGTNSGSTFFGSLVITSTGSTFTVSPAYDPSLLATRVVFKPLSNNYFYVSSQTQIYYDLQQSNYRTYAHSQGILMYSDSTQSCIVFGGATTQSVYRVSPHYEDNIAIPVNTTNVFTISTNDLINYEGSFEANEAAVPTQLTAANTDWCDSFASNFSTTQTTTTLPFKQGLASSQTLTFEAFTASVTNCNSRSFTVSSYTFIAVPPLSLFPQSSAQMVLPPQMLPIPYLVTVTSIVTTADGSSLAISVVLNLSYDKPPYFLAYLASSVTVDLNDVGTFILPLYTDPEGDMITVMPSVTGLPSFITFDSYRTYTISPTAFSQVGNITITMTISDAYNTPQSASFMVIVTNFPPYFISPLANQVTPINTPLIYTLPIMTDNEFNTIILSYTPSISWISYSNGQFTFSPTDSNFTAVGKTIIAVVLSDSVLTKSYSFTITVTNSAPYFQPSTLVNQVTPINTPLTYTLPTMKDNETDPIILSYTPKISWISYSAGVFTFSPRDTNFTAVGTTTITIVLSDTQLSSTYTFKITVTNSAPYFQPSTLVNQVTPINTPLLYILPAMKDNELDPIIFSYTPSISWISYSGGVFTFNPRDTNFSSVGTTTIKIVLSDTQLSNSYSFTITVTNTAPFFQSALVNQVTPINTPITYTLPNMIDNESDLITLTYSPLLSWVSYSGGVFTFNPKDTPNFSCVGSTKITVTLSDTQLSKVYTFNITVTNTAPYFQTALANQTTPINSPISYSLPTMIDNENDPISLTYTPLVSWITYSGGVFHFNPKDTNFSSVGTTKMTVILSDTQLTTTSIFYIIVTNTAPYFTSALVDQTTPINTPISYNLPTQVDNENDPIVFSYSPLKSFYSYSNGIFSFSPSDTDFTCVGTTTITVVLSDTKLSSSYTFKIIVTNTAPYFLTTPLVNQLTALNTAITYTLPGMKDNEANPITLSYTPIVGWITYQGGFFTINPRDSNFTAVGLTTIKVILSDTQMNNSYTFTITVTNTAPFFQSSLVNQATPINTPLQYTLPPQLDNEHDPIILTFSPKPSWITYSNGVFTFSPKDSNFTTVGTTTISVVLSDTQLSNSYTFTITVTNTAPFFQSPLVNQVTPINSPLLYTIPPQVDNEHDPITLTYNPKPSWISYSSGVFTMSPKDTNFTTVGSTTITVVLSDTQLSNSYSFTITVTNTAPFFQSALTDQIMPLNSLLKYNLPTQVDNENDHIFLTYTPLASWISYSSGVLSFSPTSADQSSVGTTTITVILSDTQLTTSSTFTITVTNSAPIFQAPLVDQTTPINTPLTYTLPAQFDLHNWPIFLSYSPTKSFYTYLNGVFTFNPQDSDFSCVGTTVISIVLTDTYLSNTYTFSITVTNSAPFFAQSLVNQTTKINSPIHYALPSEVDHENDPIYLTYSILPNFVSFLNKVFTFQPSEPDFSCIGTNIITIVLSDTQQSNTYNLSITVTNTPPYYVQAPSNQKILKTATQDYYLPSIIDDEGNQIYASFNMSASVSSFITTDTQLNKITMSPTAQTKAGTYTIVSQICDGQPLCTSQNFSIEVVSPMPFFTKAGPQNQKVNLNHVLTYSLPQFQDSPGVQSLSASVTSAPSYVTFDPNAFIFTIQPTLNSQIGSGTITGYISDPVTSVKFTFQVSVINTPPYFSSALTDQTCTQGQTSTYTLPTTADYENQKVTTTIQGALPSFATFSSGTFKFAAVSSTAVKDYTITVVLSDGNMQQTFPFKVTVQQAAVQAATDNTGQSAATSSNSTTSSSTSASDSGSSSSNQVQSSTQYADTFNASQMMNTKGKVSVAGPNGQQIVIVVYTASLKIVSVSSNGEAKVQVVSQQGGAQILTQITASTLSVKLNNQIALNFTIISQSTTDNSFTISINYPDPTKISQGQVTILFLLIILLGL